MGFCFYLSVEIAFCKEKQKQSVFWDGCFVRMGTTGNRANRERRFNMEHLDVFFMVVGVIYSCYVVLESVLQLDYQMRRRKRRG